MVCMDSLHRRARFNVDRPVWKPTRLHDGVPVILTGLAQSPEY
jgi:hypothetical protein